jgi:hypothetical protein
VYQTHGPWEFGGATIGIFDIGKFFKNLLNNFSRKKASFVVQNKIL